MKPVTYSRSFVRVRHVVKDTVFRRDVWVYHVTGRDLLATGLAAPKVKLPRKIWRLEAVLETQPATYPHLGDSVI